MCRLKFADGGLFVVASDIVPLDAVGVEVVQDSQAHLGLVDVAVLGLVSVVGLGSLAPGTEKRPKMYLSLTPLVPNIAQFLIEGVLFSSKT